MAVLAVQSPTPCADHVIGILDTERGQPIHHLQCAPPRAPSHMCCLAWGRAHACVFMCVRKYVCGHVWSFVDPRIVTLTSAPVALEVASCDPTLLLVGTAEGTIRVFDVRCGGVHDRIGLVTTNA